MAAVTPVFQAGGTSAAGNPTLHLPQSVTVGEYILLAVVQTAATTPGLPTDNLGNTWQHIGQQVNPDGLGVGLFECWVTAPGNMTITLGTIASSAYGAFIASNVFHQATGTKGGRPNGMIGSGDGSTLYSLCQCTNVGDLCVVLCMSLSQTTITQQTTGFTTGATISRADVSLSFGYQVATTPSQTFLPTWAVSPSASCVVACVSLPHA
jgi:hypothetical protein